MNIWEILDIAPTTDKKAIRRAYAARSRIFHPEESPEEFKQLYAAYQAALEYAKETFDSPRESGREIGDSLSDSDKGQEGFQDREPFDWQEDSPDQEPFQGQEDSLGQEPFDGQKDSPELLAYFADNQAKQQERLTAFFKYWEETQTPYKNPQVQAWWQDYLTSEDFQSIRWNPQLLHFLTENMDRKFYYGGDEMKLLFWEAYGFRDCEEEEKEYQGDLQKLRKCLLEALEHQKKALLDAQKQMIYEKKQSFYKKLLVAGILIVCLLIPGDILWKREGGRQYLIRYMEQQYPGTEFSRPVKTEKLPYGQIRYTLRPASHPHLLITADVTYLESSRSYKVSEDYSPQLLEYYASQYGLTCGQTEYGVYNKEQCGVIYYPDINHIHTFCETLIRMFQEHEELTHLTPVGICKENLLFPDVLLQGGVYGFSFPDPQFYEPWNMDAAQLEAQIREAIIIYMFQYEPWNLTLLQYEQWGPAYEKLCGIWNDYKGTWYTMSHEETGERLCQIYLPIYSYVESYTRFGDYSLPNYVRKMTIGSAWYYLIGQGAEVTVKEDGSGFAVRFQGNISLWGEDPMVDFNELGNWY